MAAPTVIGTLYPASCTKPWTAVTDVTPNCEKCHLGKDSHVNSWFDRMLGPDYVNRADSYFFQPLLGRNRNITEDFHLQQHPTPEEQHSHYIGNVTVLNPADPATRKIQFVVLAFHFNFSTRVLTGSKALCEGNDTFFQELQNRFLPLPVLLENSLPQTVSAIVQDYAPQHVAKNYFPDLLHEAVYTRGFDLFRNCQNPNDLPAAVPNDGQASPHITILQGMHITATLNDLDHWRHYSPNSSRVEAWPASEPHNKNQVRFALLKGIGSPETPETVSSYRHPWSREAPVQELSCWDSFVDCLVGFFTALWNLCCCNFPRS